jgi:Recombination endonuclease VII
MSPAGSWWSDSEKVAAARKKMSQKAQERWPSKLRKYGITEEQYRSETASGNKWCCGHKQFEPVTEFTCPEKSWPCRKYVSKKSITRWRALPAEEKTRLSQLQNANILPEDRRRRHLKRLYGLTPESYDAMLAKQDGKCALCLKPQDKKHFSVDHDHRCCRGKKSCGKCVRGILCQPCNRRVASLEGFLYSPSLWERTMRYLGLEKETHQ